MKNWLCNILGHKYRLHRKITRKIREIKCGRCKKVFAMNDELNCLLPLDSDLINLHERYLEAKNEML